MKAGRSDAEPERGLIGISPQERSGDVTGKESRGPERHYLSGISDIESDYPMSGLSFVDGMENITARPVFEQNMAGMK